MRRFFELLLLCFAGVFLSSASLQSKQQVFLKLIDPAGQPIAGTSLVRFYEKQIVATSCSGFSAGDPQVTFTMPSGAASATLANLLGNKQKLPSAVFTITEHGDAGLSVLSTIRLEQISIIAVSDANGSTEATLQAARIGTTYYQTNRKTGMQTVNGKTGYDFANKQSWSGF